MLKNDENEMVRYVNYLYSYSYGLPPQKIIMKADRNNFDRFFDRFFDRQFIHAVFFKKHLSSIPRVRDKDISFNNHPLNTHTHTQKGWLVNQFAMSQGCLRPVLIGTGY